MRLNRFDCPTCGQGIAVDEDGCCRTCGHDAIVVVNGTPQMQMPQMSIEQAKQQVIGAVMLYGNYVVSIGDRSSEEVTQRLYTALDALIDAVCHDEYQQRYVQAYHEAMGKADDA